LPAAAQWGLGAILLAVLFFAVNTIRQITEKGADRAVDAQKNCDAHNKTVVCEFSTTVLKMNEQHQQLVNDMRQASERREERLHELAREIRGLPSRPS
jgi:flagellar biosynthesis/type III secretory pathway M-ring protein FliF/YscJ